MSDDKRPGLEQHVVDKYLPMIGKKNWVAWVAQLTDYEIERMNAARES